MKKQGFGLICLAVALCWGGTGCGSDDNKDNSYHPAVDVLGVQAPVIVMPATSALSIMMSISSATIALRVSSSCQPVL